MSTLPVRLVHPSFTVSGRFLCLTKIAEDCKPTLRLWTSTYELWQQVRASIDEGLCGNGMRWVWRSIRGGWHVDYFRTGNRYTPPTVNRGAFQW
jgi:hypothetical protein